MQLRTLNVGCFGGGTGLPSLLGGLKTNPWLTVHAVVTMFDSGGSSGQLRDELGVLPPGDVLRCALALARNEREARNVLLARLSMPEHARLARPHRRQPAAVDDGALQRRFSRGSRRSARAARLRRSRVAGDHEPASICAEYGDGSTTTRRSRGRRRPDRRARDHAVVARARSAAACGSSRRDQQTRRRRNWSGQLLHELDADFPRSGERRRLFARSRGPSCSSPICSRKGGACGASASAKPSKR